MDEQSLLSYLEKATGKHILLVLTDNAASMLSVKHKGGSVYLRMQRMFLSADSKVVDEIAGFIKNTKTKTPLVREFIRQNIHQVKRRPPRKVNLRAEGSCHDLLEMYHAINREYFGDRVSASITWGAKGPRRAAARRTLGSYCSDNNMIRINPMLDSKRVPQYFLEFIVYHEMLHADIGIKRVGKRRSVHSKEFKRLEKMFRHYDRAIAWEKNRWL
jgi:predicted metal-dependent hydrolase